jgi:hypothetical protein
VVAVRMPSWLSRPASAVLASGRATSLQNPSPLTADCRNFCQHLVQFAVVPSRNTRCNHRPSQHQQVDWDKVVVHGPRVTSVLILTDRTALSHAVVCSDNHFASPSFLPLYDFSPD